MSYERKVQIFRNYHIIFHVTLLLSGKLLYLCTQVSEERRVKNLSHVFQSKATSGISEQSKVKKAIRRTAIAKGTNSNFSLFTLNSSLPCSSAASPYQIRCKSHSGMGD